MTRYGRLGVLAALLMLATPKLVAAQAEIAAIPQHAGPVEFISGGAGDAERAAMRAKAVHYNLKVVMTTPSGAYVRSAELTITDANGARIFETTAKGPLFYARLPEGRYVVTATRKGSQAQSRTIRVGSGAGPEMKLTVAEESVAPTRAATTGAKPDRSARARVEDKGVSLYDLDPTAAERARTQVRRYEVYPDGTKRALAPEMHGTRSVDTISDAVNPPAAASAPGATGSETPSRGGRNSSR